ncbi:copper resistance protein NlpE N-terminal domain-containing protein [Oceanihabitans sediminis]|uniref:META domain-containing protein n=1 Tax=Oceanihabitans sediminis TaxID=1812012 RepID=A0A368P8V9_9FLAO|nr:copper resistance protein NlpE N-terminal domain-containing protein [Oceanihabitans sediminis]MDX1277493.1 copper resistance protein NlpE N-terminal domain-containing protein [Oceanihabitans sediminis]MDX1772834.1 copper resistance protein NlpE N-terminal domain-containing protein [Oceanihabitans sediminis]RBP34512.1 META domain-containing protein [Oceanihabitans sediminis]RCU58906.1 META domain-containing protein [Oceanihabitans sediminis]
MKIKILGLSAIAMLFITSCNSNKKQSETDATQQEEVADMHNSQNSLDWDGTYTGTLPCADCEGIESTITLNSDLTYSAKAVYLGEKGVQFDSEGKFKWMDNGSKIQLSDEEGTMYFVGENTLTLLDKNGEKNTGELAEHYVLKKQDHSTYEFTDTKWRLVKLMGKDISDSEVFISFATDENKVFGFSGCNNFNGSFEVAHGSQLKLSEVATTLKSCEEANMDLEKEFMEMLNTADNFSLHGNTMTLNKAKMAPLATFEAVE